MNRRLVFRSRGNRLLWLALFGVVAVILGTILGNAMAPDWNGPCIIEVPQDHPAADALIQAAIDGRTECAVFTHPSN